MFVGLDPVTMMSPPPGVVGSEAPQRDVSPEVTLVGLGLNVACACTCFLLLRLNK